MAGNIATDFIGINGVAEGIGGADMATGQPLTPLERGGRGAMGFGQIVVTLAVGAKALQGGANAGKAGLQQMRLPPAGGELPPGFRQAFSPARTVCDVLGDGGKSIGTPGINRGVVTVGSEAELRSLFNQLTQGGTEMPPGTYPGTVIKMPDGTFVRLRSESKSGGPTIYITGLCGKSLKVHVK